MASIYLLEMRKHSGSSISATCSGSGSGNSIVILALMMMRRSDCSSLGLAPSTWLSAPL